MSEDATPPIDLGALRTRINELDDQLLSLLNERAQVSKDVGQRVLAARAAAQGSQGGPIGAHFAPSREREIVERLGTLNGGPLPADAIVAIFHEVIGACRSLAAPLRISTLGGPASFTHQAARQRFGAGPVYMDERSIAEIFDRVERRGADLGVVPVENSTEGSVGATLDALRTTTLSIVGEVAGDITHHLLGPEGLERKAIKAVYSHPQALGQCRHWIEEHLPNATRVPTPSTSEAARIAAQREDTAAIASELAAGLFGLTVLERSIEDLPGNRTRFLIIGRGRSPRVEGATHRTSVLFGTSNRAGALYAALGAFNDQGVSLSRLESRPARDVHWDYIFFADLDGHVEDERLKAALEALEQRAAPVKVLGSYPLQPPQDQELREG